MPNPLAHLVRVESSVVDPDAPQTTVVRAYRWVPEWWVVRTARAWFTLTDPGVPAVTMRRVLHGQRWPVEWTIVWVKRGITEVVFHDHPRSGECNDRCRDLATGTYDDPSIGVEPTP